MPAFLAAFESAMAIFGKSSTLFTNISSFSGKFSKWIEEIVGSLQQALGKIQQLVNITLVPAAKEERLQDLIITRTGDSKVGEDLFKNLKSNAIKAGQDVQQALQGALSFYSVTSQVDQLKNLNEMATRLSTLSYNGGSIEDAAKAISNAFKGEPKNAVSSLVSGFGLARGEVEKLVAVAQTGNMDNFISNFDQLLNKEGMTKEALEYMLDSPMNKWNSLIGNFRGKLADVGSKLLEALKPALDNLSSAMEDGKFDFFFDLLADGLVIAGNAVSFLVEKFLLITEWVKQNWSIIQPILSAIGVIITAVIVGGLMLLLNILLKLMLPFVPLGLAIYGLMYLFQQWGVSTSSIIGFILGRLFIMLDTIKYLIIAPIWNAFATLADFILNVFLDKEYAFKKLFYDIGLYALTFATNVVSNIESMVSGVLGSINGMITKLNSAVGFEVVGKIGGDLDLGTNSPFTDILKSKLAAYIKTEPIAPEGASDLPKIEGILDTDASQKRADDMIKTFMSAVNSLKDKVKLPGASKDRDFQLQADSSNMDSGYSSPSASPVAGSLDHIGSLGGIDSTVEVSNEDLKVIRGLAEVKSIQNFVSLTPTIQLTTGDINTGADLDTIIKNISLKLEEEFVSTAQGVYT